MYLYLQSLSTICAASSTFTLFPPFQFFSSSNGFCHSPHLFFFLSVFFHLSFIIFRFFICFFLPRFSIVFSSFSLSSFLRLLILFSYPIVFSLFFPNLISFISPRFRDAFNSTFKRFLSWKKVEICFHTSVRLFSLGLTFVFLSGAGKFGIVRYLSFSFVCPKTMTVSQKAAFEYEKQRNAYRY